MILTARKSGTKFGLQPFQNHFNFRFVEGARPSNRFGVIASMSPDFSCI